MSHQRKASCHNLPFGRDIVVPHGWPRVESPLLVVEYLHHYYRGYSQSKLVELHGLVIERHYCDSNNIGFGVDYFLKEQNWKRFDKILKNFLGHVDTLGIFLYKILVLPIWIFVRFLNWVSTSGNNWNTFDQMVLIQNWNCVTWKRSIFWVSMPHSPRSGRNRRWNLLDSWKVIKANDRNGCGIVISVIVPNWLK